MMGKRSLFVIISIIIICPAAFAGNASNTYLPFNPADETKPYDVVDYFFWDMGNRIKLNNTFLALGKKENTFRIKNEAYNRTGYQELFDLDLPTGRISVYSYLHEFLGITISSSEKVAITEEHYYDCEMDSKGKISFTTQDNNNTYYVLRFETNGGNVPFVDNGEVKVVALIFLKKGIPILGIKNSKYFTMINYNGQWIRTKAIDQVEFKNESISDSTRLLKNRPWTKLAQFIIPEDSTDRHMKDTLSFSDLYEGLFVLAKRSGFYYPAAISTIYNKKIYILFSNADFNDIFDDNSALYPLEKLKSFFWQKGTKIQAWMHYSEQWMSSTIWDIDMEDERVKIFIDDADVPMWVSFADCRQPAGSSERDEYDEYRDEENAVTDTDDNDSSDDYDDTYAEMDEEWEEFLESLEEQGIDPAELSDEEFMEMMNNE